MRIALPLLALVAFTLPALAADEAKEQARKEAEAISTFLGEVFQSPDPARDGRTITVAETLDFWLYECSIDEAPAAAEVAQWRDILAARGGKFTRLAQICQTWLDEECA